MRIYIAGTFEDRARIKLIQKQFLDAGHSIDIDWTTHKWVAGEPEETRQKLLNDYAIEDVRGVSEADVSV